MIGCKDMGAFEKTKPYFDLMGKRTVECGGPGAGSATKLCNNLALAAQMIGICEAMNLGESLGVDPIVLADVMNTSTAKSWSCEVNNPHPQVGIAKGGKMPSSKNYEGGFGTKLMLKDLSLAVIAGAEAGVSLPIGTASRELYKLAELHGLGEKDFGVVLQFLRGK
jgi:3-hydroxyisobutyrate dehydrogenase